MIRYRPADSLIPFQAALESVGLHGCQMIIANEKGDLSRPVAAARVRGVNVSAGARQL